MVSSLSYRQRLDLVYYFLITFTTLTNKSQKEQILTGLSFLTRYLAELRVSAGLTSLLWTTIHVYKLSYTRHGNKFVSSI